MMTEHSLAIDFDTNVTVSDVLEQKELDVTVLKQDDIDAPVREHTSEVEALDARANELAQIAEYIKKNGATRPTEKHFAPKSQSWSRNVKSKAEKIAENPAYIERRGRPRKSYTKDVAFISLYNGSFKRAPRGRAPSGQIRESFTIYYTNVEKVSEGEWTRKQLEAMAKMSR